MAQDGEWAGISAGTLGVTHLSIAYSMEVGEDLIGADTTECTLHIIMVGTMDTIHTMQDTVTAITETDIMAEMAITETNT